MASNSNFKKQIAEIRKWAEADIGRPKLAVVGGWNDAYPNMVKSFMKESALQIADLVPNEHYVPKWWRQTGRVELVETCNRSQKCSKKYYSKTGWPATGIKMDFDELDTRLAKYEENGSKDAPKRRNDSCTGPLCVVSCAARGVKDMGWRVKTSMLLIRFPIRNIQSFTITTCGATNRSYVFE